MSAHISNVRPDFDQVIVDIVDYVHKQKITSREAFETARYCQQCSLLGVRATYDLPTDASACAEDDDVLAL